MILNIEIQEFINSLNIEIPPKEDFLQLSNLCPINPIKPENNSNLERGILLYGLISKYKPKNVLEIGRAEGFSTLCMAWSMSDNDIDGTIHTIDPKPFDTPIERINTWNKTEKQETVILSTKELWNKVAKREWINKIKVFTGLSGEILKKTSKDLPHMDMGFIDGHHAYNAVRHDFHAFLRIASKDFHLLFDDYDIDGEVGVSRAINEEVSPYFDMTLINNPEESNKRPAMCLINSDSLNKSLDKIYPKSKSDQIITEYLKWEKRWKLRKSLNTKIPFLSKIRFNR